MTFWKHAKIAIQESDIVAEVLDARMPELSRNHEIEELVEREGKFLLFVLNKGDLVPRELIDKIINSLGNEKCVSVSGKKNLGMRRLKEVLIIIGKRHGFSRPRVCFVGYPNVGKSSVINALAKSARAPVSSVPGTTKGIQWISLPSLKVIDSPGVIPFDERDEARIALIGSRDPERLKRPERAALEIIRFLRQAYPGILSSYYGVSESIDENDLFTEIGLRKHFLLKGGESDTRRTALSIVKDWQSGKIALG